MEEFFVVPRKAVFPSMMFIDGYCCAEDNNEKK
jgi:hypothetical protein